MRDQGFEQVQRGRVPQLDGLRAIAIVLVIAHHAGLVSIGWIGVNLFFALSGFLITGILRRSREEEFFWRPFYIKRATRILPPLLPFFLFCALTTPVARHATLLPYIFFGANVAQSLPHASVTDLTVLWSLAVEEHFYLLWPFAVRFLGRRALIRLLAAILLLEPFIRLLGTVLIHRWEPIYFLTPFQMDGLAAGALLAVLLEEERSSIYLRRWAPWGVVATLVILGLCSAVPSFSREQDSLLFNSMGYSLLAALSAAVVAVLVLRPQSLLSRILSLSPLVFVGLVSYGLYLYHGPVIQLTWSAMQAEGFHRGRIIELIGATFALLVSWISFRFYEAPLIAFGRKSASRLARRIPSSVATLT
jgi:peptidoglycan/LPS O-acetylase OafA/YrhL